MAEKKKDPITTWDRIKHLSLPNQVKALCTCMDQANSETKPTDK